MLKSMVEIRGKRMQFECEDYYEDGYDTGCCLKCSKSYKGCLCFECKCKCKKCLW